MRYVVKLTLEQAEKLGIARCASCGWPRNNHFDFGKKVCAHTKECTGWKLTFSMGAPIRRKRKS